MADILSPTGIEKPLGAELHSRAMVNRNYDRTNQIAIDAAKLSKGSALYQTATADSGAVGTLAVINNVATFTFLAGRNYAIVWDFEFYGSITNGFFEFTIATCSVADGAALTTGLTIKNRRRRSVQEGGSSFRDSGGVEARVTYGVDTTLQIKFLAELVANSGTVVVTGSANNPQLIIIDDVGDLI